MSKLRVREEARGASVVSDEELRRAKQVEDLSRAHGDYLRALARKLCQRQFDPDDLVQEVLVKMMQFPIPIGANERAWLGRVAHNLFIDWLRRHKTRREDELSESVPQCSDEPAWWQTLSLEQVQAMIARLPDEQRVTFEMFVFGAKSYDEIAAALDIAKATVGTRILRARQKVRDMLAREHDDG